MLKGIVGHCPYCKTKSPSKKRSRKFWQTTHPYTKKTPKLFGVQLGAGREFTVFKIIGKQVFEIKPRNRYQHCSFGKSC